LNTDFRLREQEFGNHELLGGQSLVGCEKSAGTPLLQFFFKLDENGRRLDSDGRIMAMMRTAEF